MFSFLKRFQTIAEYEADLSPAEGVLGAAELEFSVRADGSGQLEIEAEGLEAADGTEVAAMVEGVAIARALVRAGRIAEVVSFAPGSIPAAIAEGARVALVSSGVEGFTGVWRAERDAD